MGRDGDEKYESKEPSQRDEESVLMARWRGREFNLVSPTLASKSGRGKTFAPSSCKLIRKTVMYCGVAFDTVKVLRIYHAFADQFRSLGANVPHLPFRQSILFDKFLL